MRSASRLVCFARQPVGLQQWAILNRHASSAVKGTGNTTVASEKPKSALDLYDELSSYVGEDAGQQTAKKSATSAATALAGERKALLVKDPRVRGSPRRLANVAAALVGKTYGELKQMVPRMTNRGARQVERALENARRRAMEKWDVQNEDYRLIVEQAWAVKAETSPRLYIHGRGKRGLMHRRWGKLFIMFRYISPEDDSLMFERVSAALQEHGVPFSGVRRLLRYGPRRTVAQVAKAGGLTRQQGRSYLKMLTQTRPEFRREGPTEKVVKQKEEQKAAKAAAMKEFMAKMAEEKKKVMASNAKAKQ